MPDPPVSILSHGEQDVAGHLREDPGASPACIAGARGESEEDVEKAIAHIREKTRRASATLDRRPFTGAVARDLDPGRRRALIEAPRAAAAES